MVGFVAGHISGLVFHYQQGFAFRAAVLEPAQYPVIGQHHEALLAPVMGAQGRCSKQCMAHCPADQGDLATDAGLAHDRFKLGACSVYADGEQLGTLTKITHLAKQV